MHITGSKSSECVARSTAAVFPGNTKEALVVLKASLLCVATTDPVL